MKFKFLKVTFACLVMTTSCFFSAANATIITDLSARDWLVGGDTSITYDSSTGLEWLDITITGGNTILDTEAESFFGDFRWANSSEIEELFDAVINGSGTRVSTDATIVANAMIFNQLFGVVGAAGTTGVSRGSLISSGQYGLGYVRFTRASSVTVRDPLAHCCYSETDQNGVVGSWLVRSVDVPEPSTLAIFALGMIGLASRRFKKQS